MPRLGGALAVSYRIVLPVMTSLLMLSSTNADESNVPLEFPENACRRTTRHIFRRSLLVTHLNDRNRQRVMAIIGQMRFNGVVTQW